MKTHKYTYSGYIRPGSYDRFCSLLIDAVTAGYGVVSHLAVDIQGDTDFHFQIIGYHVHCKILVKHGDSPGYVSYYHNRFADYFLDSVDSLYGKKSLQKA